MKTIHSFIVLLVLINSVFTEEQAYIQGETLVFESYILGAERFLGELKYYLKDIKEGRKLRINTVDLRGSVFWEGPGYWDMINVINDSVEDDIKSIYVLLPNTLIKKLSQGELDHILAELVITTDNVPRIVPNFDVN